MVLHLDIAGIKMYECVFPPKWLLKKYASIKEVIENKKNLILKENEELIQLRDFLLPLLMNGQVKIN
jgi:type I restriction enzyme S subunit